MSNCSRLFAVAVVTGWQRGWGERESILDEGGQARPNRQTNRTAWPFVGRAVRIDYTKTIQSRAVRRKMEEARPVFRDKIYNCFLFTWLTQVLAVGGRAGRRLGHHCERCRWRRIVRSITCFSQEGEKYGTPLVKQLDRVTRQSIIENRLGQFIFHSVWGNDENVGYKCN